MSEPMKDKTGGCLLSNSFHCPCTVGIARADFQTLAERRQNYIFLTSAEIPALSRGIPRSSGQLCASFEKMLLGLFRSHNFLLLYLRKEQAFLENRTPHREKQKNSRWVQIRNRYNLFLSYRITPTV